ncbi:MULTISPECIES: non-canonical purine NTP pyrophosphatase [Pseudomonas]|uniref:AAA family ATPase n=1 Tax=Pseudomonas taiwanensis TaxID=470150 RepID=A0A7L9GHX2_9PSED|nr:MULTISPECIES: non-canonical purine NTP pyrophosphatase [Pseudomonas]QOJ91907.1 AAA family ATPase [Pseudomonas taiwanensis]WQQ37671.1 non-canonical purine NTP pyrophosphatase [Pseudomonas putida]
MIKLFFLSSNLTKIAHFDYLLREHPIMLLPPPNYGKPYYEPRIDDRDELLKESIQSANLKLAKNGGGNDQPLQPDMAFITDNENASLLARYASKHQHRIFFIEDTSIAIEALSKGKEFPGVDVKYWMRETSFSDLDQQLKLLGNNRRVTVRSDIVLYLPPHLRDTPEETYKVFVGEVAGSIVDEESSFKTNKVYPWLDNKTFNKWFVPEGAKKPISQLSISSSLKYDFRSLALQKLISFLRKKDLLDTKQSQVKPLQGELFPRRNFIICGATCAGKTVLASSLTRFYAYQHIEASDFMRCALYSRHGYTTSMKIQTFAADALKKDPGIVARQIASYLKNMPTTGIVITGFRSPEEIKILEGELSGVSIETLYIDSSLEIRYQRNRKRNRADAPISMPEFRKKNDAQNAMGLDAIRAQSKVIQNEKSIFSYIRMTLRSLTDDSHLISFNCDISKVVDFLPLEQALLISMLIDHKKGLLPLTTTQIARNAESNIPGLRIKGDKYLPMDKNNVSRFFNQRFSPHFEAFNQNEKLYFSLSHTGISAAISLLRKISSVNQ